jgi:hypothetical protein
VNSLYYEKITIRMERGTQGLKSQERRPESEVRRK